MNAFSGGLSRLALAGMIAAGLMSTAQAEDRTIHIGFQKYGTLILLKAQGLLEEKLGPQGYAIEWTEFPAGPQLLEALNVGAIDFGTTGEAPPIFAQAAGAPLVYVGVEPAAPKAEAILVPEGQPAQDSRRPQGQDGRAEQGLERPLPAGEGAREGGPLPIRTSRSRSCRRPTDARPSRRALSTPG